MYAYNKLYLTRAQNVMAGMLDYAVNVQNIGLSIFYDMFLKSSISYKISTGDPYVIAGRSGPELALDILDENKRKYDRVEPAAGIARSPEYWCGYYLAYYQWISGNSFKKINSFIDITQVLNMYPKYHEMDIRQFVDVLDKKRTERRITTYLQLFRKKMGYSQSELADYSGVPVKTIQQYEQRQKNINKAAAETVIGLARV